MKPVSHGEVISVFNKNIENLRRLIAEIVRRLPKERTCDCGSALEHARLSA